MRARRVLGTAAAASLLLGAAACGDDDDTTATATTTPERTEIEVTVTSDGLEGMPSEIPAGVVEVTLVNESGNYASVDISRVQDGTTEDEFVEGVLPLREVGEFPGFLESNAGIEADDGETTTALIVLRGGEHMAWFAPEGDGGSGDDDAETETVTETETETETETVTETETDSDDTSTTTTGADEGTTSTTAGEAGTDIVTVPLTVTDGDDDAELPEADGTITATDYEFDVAIPGEGGTINFRNDGPQQFHHAVLMDFGDIDPAAVEDAFPVLLESEGDGSAVPDVDIDLDAVDFDFAGSGVFGPDEAAGTFDAGLTDGSTYVVACFIQDRTGGPPHAIAYDMWEVFQAGAAGDSTTTTDG